MCLRIPSKEEFPTAQQASRPCPLCSKAHTHPMENQRQRESGSRGGQMFPCTSFSPAFLLLPMGWLAHTFKPQNRTQTSTTPKAATCIFFSQHLKGIQIINFGHGQLTPDNICIWWGTANASRLIFLSKHLALMLHVAWRINFFASYVTTLHL